MLIYKLYLARIKYNLLKGFASFLKLSVTVLCVYQIQNCKKNYITFIVEKENLNSLEDQQNIYFIARIFAGVRFTSF